MPLSQDVYIPQVVASNAPQVMSSRSPGRVWFAWSVGVGIIALLLALVLLAPLAASSGYTLLALALYKAFANLCHQIPARSFHFYAAPLAVCARCWGIYSGFAILFALYPFLRSLPSARVPARHWLLLAVLPTSVDFLLGFAGVWENTHWSRALTGAIAGAGAAFYVVPGIVEISQQRWRGIAAKSN